MEFAPLQIQYLTYKTKINAFVNQALEINSRIDLNKSNKYKFSQINFKKLIINCVIKP